MVNLHLCSKAWKFLAKSWENPKESEGNYYSEFGDAGICSGILALLRIDGISRDDCNFMLSEIGKLQEYKNKYCWPHDRLGAFERRDFCKIQSDKCKRWADVSWSSVLSTLEGIKRFKMHKIGIKRMLEHGKSKRIEFQYLLANLPEGHFDVLDWCDEQIKYIERIIF